MLNETSRIFKLSHLWEIKISLMGLNGLSIIYHIVSRLRIKRIQIHWTISTNTQRRNHKLWTLRTVKPRGGNHQKFRTNQTTTKNTCIVLGCLSSSIWGPFAMEKNTTLILKTASDFGRIHLSPPKNTLRSMVRWVGLLNCRPTTPKQHPMNFRKQEALNNVSGQIIKFHQPRFIWNMRFPLLFTTIWGAQKIGSCGRELNVTRMLGRLWDAMWASKKRLPGVFSPLMKSGSLNFPWSTGWLIINKDPYIGLWYNPYMTWYFHSLYNPTNQGWCSVCSLLQVILSQNLLPDLIHNPSCNPLVDMGLWMSISNGHHSTCGGNIRQVTCRTS